MIKKKVIIKWKLIQSGNGNHVINFVKKEMKVKLHKHATLVYSTDDSVIPYINKENKRRKRRIKKHRTIVKSLKSKGIMCYTDPSVL